MAAALEVVEDEVPPGDRVDRVRGDLAEAELARDRTAVGVEVDPRQRARAERQAPGLALGEGEARAVAREHPEVGQQMVAEIDRLGALQVGVAGHRPVEVLLGARQQRRPSGPSIAALGVGRALARVHREIGHDLVVARARRVQPPADRPAISVRRRSIAMWMSSSSSANGKRPSLSSPLDRVEAREQRVAILRGDDPARGEHPRVRARLRDVLRPQAPVEGRVEAFRRRKSGCWGSWKRDTARSV